MPHWSDSINAKDAVTPASFAHRCLVEETAFWLWVKCAAEVFGQIASEGAGLLVCDVLGHPLKKHYCGIQLSKP